MKYQPVRGRGVASLPAALRTGGASNELPEKGFVGIGFRLAHDDSGRVIRDGSWRNTAAYSRDSKYVCVDADYCSGRLGFRLARERA
jgi:formylglycine-generating enzyme required for sulfatase activity